MNNHTITSLRKQHVVVTGYLWERHAQVQDRIRWAGGHVQDEVSASTDLLVRGMPNPQYKQAEREMGTKLLAAAELGTQGHHVHVIWHDDLHRLLSQGQPARCDRLDAARPPTKSRRPLGEPYVPDDELACRTGHVLLQRDLNAVDRGRRGHAATRNALAEAVRKAGLLPLKPPRKPSQDTPDYDLAWYQPDGRFVVAEVKSLTHANETQQLRLGLGQLLDYRHALGRRARLVSAVLAVERRPASAHWRGVCQANGVELVWHATMNRLFRLKS
jgi:hypothetical protein